LPFALRYLLATRPEVLTPDSLSRDLGMIFPDECDPDSFFRQLYEEGKMDEYIDRGDRRP
jgi:hypothetical protein